ncbi:hypothetical protein A4X09_0g2470 [Tilletia walkeri]|uniref:Carbohydrate kinase PfkB domain-containing protein n=1 Tax=Tilletia walkeri TaxID=117179 RepID=A0A8X7NBA1_9BASI|nr:hypothetical protein A4X09_0g2470 [Tilletia walkeri]
MNSLSRFVRVHESVIAAVASRRPCVALESTIITHGLKYPNNLETALACEDAIREQGAVPATIALLDGVAHIGLDRGQLERIAEAAGKKTSDDGGVVRSKPIKAGRRDLATVLALGKGAIGGTTVSGTMALAHLAGIPIFATGGIGGVHRGAERTMDISADLTELSRTPVSVFCSGAKSILDLPLTLEYLETAGVTVASFHPRGRFPAFYSQDSGLDVTPVRDISHAAAIIHASASLGLKNGIVFGVPIPDSHAPAAEEIQRAVEQAVSESVEQGIDRRGKEATPWLLARVGQLTDKALESNMALVVNNARVAAQTAARYCSMQDEQQDHTSSHSSSNSFLSSASQVSKPRLDAPISILVVGCAAVDISARARDAFISQSTATTHPGQISLSPGGVARNIAEAASRLSSASSQDPSTSIVKLIAPIADDAFGTFLLDEAESAGMRQDGFYIVKRPSAAAGKQEHSGDEQLVPRTAVCSLSLNSEGNLLHGIADFDATLIPHKTDSPSNAVTTNKVGIPQHFAEHLRECLRSLVTSSAQPIVAFDANLGPAVLRQLIETKQEHPSATPAPVLLYEPTSLPKCGEALIALRDFMAGRTRRSTTEPLIDICTPNALELLGMHAAAVELGLVRPSRRINVNMSSAVKDAVSEEILQAANDLSSLFGWIFLKREKYGVTVFRRRRAWLGSSSLPVLEITQHPVPLRLEASEIANTTGAGDTFAGALLAGISLMGPPSSWTNADLEDIVTWAQRAAACTVRSPLSVAPELNDLPFVKEIKKQ